MQVILEPGRFARRQRGRARDARLSEADGRQTILIVDAAMNDLIRRRSTRIPRPGAGDARRAPERDHRRGRSVCESGDFLARDRELPALEPGELVCVRSAGAYGFVMSSNYNARPRAAEVLVDGGRYHVVRARETFEDLVRGESPSPP